MDAGGGDPAAVSRRRFIGTDDAVASTAGRMQKDGTSPMSNMLDPNDPDLRSFIDVASDSHFPIQNLPFGVFSVPDRPQPRCGVAIGDQILDLAVLERAGLLRVAPSAVFGGPCLNDFIGLGRTVTGAVRCRISELLRDSQAELRDDAALRGEAFVPMAHASLHLPVEVGGFSDFMLSKEHSKNCVDIVGGACGGQLWPNWHHLPMGYNSRASSVVVSGTPVRRPWGQLRGQAEAGPRYGISQELDFELETALVIGKGNRLGEPIHMAQAAEHAFGVVLLNDWSARDIQQWEAQPLGVFNSKNLATSISPWIVTLDALEPYRVCGPAQDPAPLPYLHYEGRGNIDVHLEARIRPSGATAVSTVCRSRLAGLYWNVFQQIVHHTSAGCNLQPGDLLGSGTVSNGADGALGCLFEVTRGGRQSFDLERGGSRMYIEDGDEVSLTGWCQGRGHHRVGFGECTGRVLPALDRSERSATVSLEGRV